ncbi:hypothetical protein EYC59_04565 [Candidatus Saccharibacteria bacterium]|nr:MAG: hypothetical protein EYC59_04565 [Candidatus Saccharibacteria bacterium]
MGAGVEVSSGVPEWSFDMPDRRFHDLPIDFPDRRSQHLSSAVGRVIGHTATGVVLPFSSAERMPDLVDFEVCGHHEFTELTSPSLTREAWKIHADNYFGAKFVTADALDENGYLKPDIDTSRGPNATYRLAFNKETTAGAATMRKYNLSPGQDYTDLPTMKLCRNLTDEGLAILKNVPNPEAQLKEIAALARTSADPTPLYEVIRRFIDGALGKEEVWFFCIVTDTYDKLTKRLGRKNFTVIGEDVRFEGDSRISPTTALRPTLFYPDRFHDGLLESYEDALAVGDNTKPLQDSLVFYTNGLSVEEIAKRPRVYRALEDLKAKRTRSA